MDNAQRLSFLVLCLMLTLLTCTAQGVVDGGWSVWSNWTDCSAPCTRTMTRSRSCDSPRPSPGGSQCVGEIKETRPCPCNIVFDPKAECDKSPMIISGVAFLTDPCDCAKFYHCQRSGNNWIAALKSCPPCTQWRQDVQTCMPDGTKCTLVLDQTVVVIKGDECIVGEDVRKVVLNKPELFYEVNSNLERACPAGTHFNFSSCACDIVVLVVLPNIRASATEDISCLSFDQGWDGLGTSRGVWVTGQGVQIKDGGISNKAGQFGGSAWLEIPYFQNFHFGDFSESFFFKNSGVLAGKRGLISNGDCTGHSNIDVVLEDDVIKAHVTTDSGEGSVEAKVVGSGWHHVVLRYRARKYLELFVDNNKYNFTFLLEGRIKSSQCAMVLGRVQLTDYFVGEMDEVCFYGGALSNDEILATYQLLNRPKTP